MRLHTPNFFKGFFPPHLLSLIKKIINVGNGNGKLIGNFTSWDEARRASTGYDSELILEKTKNALLKVKNGEAVYERDSVVFDKIQYSWPLLAGLMWVAARSEGRLNVLDFGGSLGSTYYQNRLFLQSLPKIRWNIIEQPDHVKTGKEYFEDDTLKFFPDTESCFSVTTPDVIILSSVLQYLENPHETLNKLFELPCDYVIIDRTPFWEGSADRLCVQQVPPSIYPASYPSWILSKEKFLEQTRVKGFRNIADFENLDRQSGPMEFSYRGVILCRETEDRV